MEELILYFVDIFNIKTGNKFTVLDIEDELGQVKDIHAFRTFAKERMNLKDYEYMSGLQKFMIVIKKYKEKEYKELNGDRIKKSISQASETSNKVGGIEYLISSNKDAAEGEWSGFKDNGINRFKQFEIKALKKAGNPRQALYLRNSHSGRDPLAELLQVEFDKVIRETGKILLPGQKEQTSIGKKSMAAIANMVNSKKV